MAFFVEGFFGLFRGACCFLMLDKFASPIGASERPRQHFGFFLPSNFPSCHAPQGLARWEAARLGRKYGSNKPGIFPLSR
jgi:hypothetical protein